MFTLDFPIVRNMIYIKHIIIYSSIVNIQYRRSGLIWTESIQKEEIMSQIRQNSDESKISQTTDGLKIRQKPDGSKIRHKTDGATEAQIAANRANAQKSTGPRTAEGKEKVAQNANH